MAILLSRGWDMGTAFIMSLVGAMGFCLIVLRIITRLSSIYFNIGTFAIYILVSYCATNLEITKGAFGISLPSLISHPETIGILYSGIVLCVI